MAPVKTNGRGSSGVKLFCPDTWVATATISATLRQIVIVLMLPPKQVSQISKNLFLKQSLTGRFICFANGIDVLDDKMVWYMDDAHGAAFRKPSVSDGIIKCCHS
jgi:hypothetical protein